ncbi:MAG: pyruvate formate-lyase-activating protein [Bacilli bacterium]|nr:pyruvate formate-lyase-activating protein [Bacilli bacterium]
MATVGYYNSIESFALVDGPGVRSVLFLQGCPFRCLYCHNPETWAFTKENPITAEEAVKKLGRYANYWRDNGGITISGGEPLSQIDFVLEMAKEAKAKGYTVVIDTAGGPFTREEPFFSKFQELLKYLDLILLDVKGIDEETHQKMTGQSLTNPLDMFKYLDEVNFPIWIRYVLVPGYTDQEELLRKTDEFASKLRNVERFEVLPYHPYALGKYDKYGIPYRLRDVMSPSRESIARAEEILNVDKYQAYKK